MQKVADQIEPLGEDRADMRAARNTTRLLSALATDVDEYSEVEYLRHYLEVNTPDDKPQLPKVKKAQ